MLIAYGFGSSKNSLALTSSFPVSLFTTPCTGIENVPFNSPLSKFQSSVTPRSKKAELTVALLALRIARKRSALGVCIRKMNQSLLEVNRCDVAVSSVLMKLDNKNKCQKINPLALVFVTLILEG